MTDTKYELPILEDRLVCFIDILGFAALIKQASKEDHEAIKRIDAALKSIQTVGNKIAGWKGSHPAVHIFSDSVIISADTSGNAVLALCKALAELSWELLKIGVFIRGGIAVGKVSSDRKRPWGPAIVTAYQMESTVADVPRIVAHSSFLKHVSDNEVELQEPLLRRDTADGVFFIDSISYLIGEFEKGNGSVGRDDFTIIRDNLNAEHSKATDSPGVYKKIDWLTSVWDLQFDKPNSNLREFRTNHGARWSFIDAFDRGLNS